MKKREMLYIDRETAKAIMNACNGRGYSTHGDYAYRYIDANKLCEILGLKFHGMYNTQLEIELLCPYLLCGARKDEYKVNVLFLQAASIEYVKLDGEL